MTRHFIFWICFLSYFFYVNLLPASTQDLFHAKIYIRSLQLMIYAPVSFLAMYIAIHILLPRFIIPGKYIALFLVMTALTIFYFSIACLITVLLAKMTQPLPYNKLSTSFKWFQPVRYGIGFPLTSTILVIIVTLIKNFHLKQKEHALLLRQKINTELQLLKTRFRPQFLYNALLHISHLIRNQSPDSPSILLKLSELLSYVLYENEKEKVPLENELEVLKTFLFLKNTFHQEEISIQFIQQVEPSHLFISPLLLLSIIENCLDNLHHKGEEPVSLNLIIKTSKNELHVQLECREKNEIKGESPDYYSRLLNSLNRVELLYLGTKTQDLFSENGVTYLILEFRLGDVSIWNEKTYEMSIIA